jgi:cyclase
MNGGLVKTVRFASPNYIGDPINAIKIFNEKEVDEIVFLDISSNTGVMKPNFDLLPDITSECFIPFTYGGGVSTIEDIKKLLNIGIEKISINSHALEDIKIVEKAAGIFGSQSIVVSVDVKKNVFGKYQIYSRDGKKKHTIGIKEYIKQLEEIGAGELFINSIDRDGMMKGYDVDLIRMVTETVSIPVIACGGAGKLDDCAEVIKEGGASAAAAGSLFVYHGKHKAVLINYPTQNEMNQILH